MTMPSAELSAKERAVMFALLAEARKLSNPELEERVGFRLDGKERRKLNDLKLVESDKPGRAYEHELSDAGWRWCAEQTAAAPGGRATSMERALYAILAGLGRYAAATDQSLADIFHHRHGALGHGDGDVRARIETEYLSLAPGRGEFVKLRELRMRLADIHGPDVDSALEQMYIDQQINLIPQSNQQALSAADRESAFRVGGEYKHLISIE
jgi:hypothetical protein